MYCQGKKQFVIANRKIGKIQEDTQHNLVTEWMGTLLVILNESKGLRRHASQNLLCEQLSTDSFPLDNLSSAA